MPLLLRGLSLPDPPLRAGVIETLLSAAQVDLETGSKTSKEGSVVSEHAVSLTKAMLKNSSVAEMPDMVRFRPFLTVLLWFCPSLMSKNRGYG